MRDPQTHARIAKKIINHDAYGINLLCMWDDCERSATSIYRFRACRHPVGWPCRYADELALAHGSQGAHIWMAFCSERHAYYFRYSEGWRALAMIDQQGRAYGNLPTGSKGIG
jgi:hypothetical protein